MPPAPRPTPDPRPAPRRSAGRRRLAGGVAVLLSTAIVAGACSSTSTQGAAPGTTGGPGTTLPAPPGASTPGSTVPPAGTPAAQPVSFYADSSFDYDTKTVLGGAAYGLSEVGEVLAITDTINEAGASYQTYTETYLAWGDQLAQRAEEAAAAGDTATQRALSLRASNYYSSALFYVLGSDLRGQEQELYDGVRNSWDTFVGLTPGARAVEIPYEGRSMPGWLFTPPDAAPGPRPTVILNNGSDGQAPALYAYGAAEAVARGWNALIFEGPGQGSMLFIDELPFRSDWEAVITPVVDYLVTQPDVEPSKIALFGLSMGGQLVTRAAAHEKRLAAVVTAPGVVSPWLGFPSTIRDIVSDDQTKTNAAWNEIIVPHLTAEEQFLLAKRLEIYGADAMEAARAGKIPTDFWTLAQIPQAQDVTTVAPQVTAPTLVLNYEDEAFYPGQAQQLYDLLTSPKDLVTLTAAEGAQLHCSPMAPQVHNEVVFDWLRTKLA